MSAEVSPPRSWMDRFRWPLRLGLMVLVPVILLTVLELGLRAFGFGYDWHLYQPVPGTELLGSNPRFGYRFFPKSIARTPLFFSFPAEKPDNTYRIFLLGASAAAGIPNSTYGFGQILDEMLDSQFPGVDFELINTGMPAINSHVVLPVAKECVGYDPDLFIVYLGNNEAIGPFNAGTAEQRQGVTAGRVQTIVKSRTTKIGQLIQSVGESVRGTRDLNKAWGGMTMYSDNYFPADDPVLQGVYNNFEQNLRGIVKAARESGAKVLLNTVSVNLKDSAPFFSLHRSDMDEAQIQKWEREYLVACGLAQAGRHAEAETAFRSLLARDDKYAELHFRLARSLQELDRWDEALQHYQAALDQDALPFRSNRKINNVLRGVAAEDRTGDVILADCQKLMLDWARARESLPGRDEFYEHVHLTFQGNYQLARFMFDAVVELLPPDILARRLSSKPLPSIEECGRNLALSNFEKYTMLGQMLILVREVPFTNQYNHQESLAYIQEQMAWLKDPANVDDPQILVDNYLLALERRPLDLLLHYNFAQLLLALGDQQGYARELEFIESRMPTKNESGRNP
jgi:tetratricopeptide (TPR) repeat protein